MWKKSFLLCTLALFWVFLPMVVQAGEWRKGSADDELNIVVYIRDVPDSPYRECRGETVISAPMEAVVDLIVDTGSFPEWMHNIKTAKVLEEISEMERLTYTAQQLPWPVTDRDLVVYSIMNQDTDTGVVTIEMAARPDAYPEQEGHVRIPELKSSWQLTPQGEDRVAVVYQVHANPGGRLSARITNTQVEETPLNTLRGMHKMMANPE